MENWGLVTYREDDMLIDKKTASSRQLQRVAEVVIHELAHQWFGNLVTMEWWEDLWLNEGFATWMETGVTHELYPAWSMWEQFITDMQGRALSLDSLRSSHPIQVPIKRAEEVEQVFDAISYCKGSCVVRMVHAVLGADAFRKGLQIYFKRHAYGNTITAALWAAWAEASGQDIPKLMGPWTKQQGYPLVKVTKSSSGAYELSQSWFLADGSAGDDRLCPIPIKVKQLGVKDDSDGVVSILMSEKTTTLPGYDASSGIKLNWGQHTLMRVSYPPEDFSLLCDAVSSGEMPPIDSAALLGDSYALAKAGINSVENVVTLMSKFGRSTNYTEWVRIAGVASAFDKILMGGGEELSEVRATMRKCVSTMMSKVWAEIGWDARSGDGHTDALLRATLMGMQKRFSEDPAFEAECVRRFE